MVCVPVDIFILKFFQNTKIIKIFFLFGGGGGAIIGLN